MANFTTRLIDVCREKSGVPEMDYDNIPEIIEGARPYLFDDYTIFDEAYRDVLETKIVKHFLTREIGYETVGLWKFKLNTRLDEIMPLYNQLYQSELLKFNPLYDIDLYTEHTKDNDTDSNGNSLTEGNRTTDANGNKITDTKSKDNRTHKGTDNEDTTRRGNRNAVDDVKSAEDTNQNVQSTSDNRTSDVGRDLYSDTPQGGLDGLESEKYLTNARKTLNDQHATGKEDSTSTGKTTTTGNTTSNETHDETANRVGTNESKDTANGTLNSTESQSNTTKTIDNVNKTDVSKITSTEKYIQHVYGHTSGSNYSKLVKDFRETFLNIDMMVIEELEDLFMGIYF